tara:strand:+ start:12576 stop:12782 length:207 start_codon:yes stop_codon:yes gene_type:complete
MFQGLIGKIGLPQEPGVDGVLVKEFLADMGIIPHGDEPLLGKFIYLAFGESGVTCQVIHIERFFAVGQ